MSDYRIFETEQFQDDLKSIIKAGRARIVERLRDIVYSQLRKRPRFGSNIRKLKGYSPETWRYRIGDWRFFYEIEEEEKIVYIITGSHQGSAYR